MEFNEKIQELRKKSGLTQEQLAEKLFVSRTAISKWESGRGYPSIDSLKCIAKIFNVSIDELLSSEEIIDIAKEENNSNMSKFNNLVCGLLDLMSIFFIFLPLYGQRIEDKIYSVSLINCYEISSNMKVIYIFVFSLMFIIGIAELIFNTIENKKIQTKVNIISLIVQINAILFFSLARQPYVTATMFMLLIIKISIIMKNMFQSEKRP